MHDGHEHHQAAERLTETLAVLTAPCRHNAHHLHELTHLAEALDRFEKPRAAGELRTLIADYAACDARLEAIVQGLRQD